MLQFERYSKSYSGRLVLKIDRLTLEPGIYWIKGVNGSGKSTFLKTIAGLLPIEGDILLNDTLHLKEQPVAFRRIVNFAEAEPIFPGFLTGMEMIRLFASAKGAPLNTTSHYIESMSMAHYINEPLVTYSSGMLKKLSLVLAFIGEPTLILLDEPLITMDTASLAILYTWITEKHANGKTSFLLSSHQELSVNTSITLKEILIADQTLTFAG
ncbi:ABC transporter ATP-binding protein [Ohtaekwangia koreensis]|uniref:ABC-2 type transport system ATP-binding protein n=1 Tax=Ohtaekwangia koreensis TaxID=688867 RepID=A0A1T5M183_9BACT|nr:ABC transporter ATP-binding protein [Ohtaekwangia koreensis]SKC82010.1 ABC-2 type transport system ATP-binding protein [Ohtaekwangia koreensis]